MPELSATQKADNRHIHELRARVELSFSRAENPFLALKSCWRENDAQLTNLVWFAVGVANARL